MKILLSIFTLLTLIACDAPQRTRLQSGYDYMTNPYKDGNSGQDKTPESGDFNPGNPGTGTESSEYSHCDLSYKYHTIDIGHFAICQSRTNESKFKFKTQVANRNVQVCLIPTYRDQSGGSTYLGRPQCVYTEAGKDYEGYLYKDRSGFSGYSINGVIVMKYPLLNEYHRCMNASISWPASACPSGAYTNQTCLQAYSSCPNGAATNPSCAAAAREFMTATCEQFKSKYRNSYADISTR